MPNKCTKSNLVGTFFISTILCAHKHIWQRPWSRFYIVWIVKIFPVLLLTQCLSGLVNSYFNYFYEICSYCSCLVWTLHTKDVNMWFWNNSCRKFDENIVEVLIIRRCINTVLWSHSGKIRKNQAMILDVAKFCETQTFDPECLFLFVIIIIICFKTDQMFDFMRRVSRRPYRFIKSG